MLGNKRVMGNNIMHYMTKKGIERAELAKILGVPYSTLTSWINGDNYPRIDKIQTMADYFGIDKADLVEEQSSIRTVKAVKIPVFGRVAAGIPLEMIEDIYDHEEVPAEMVKDGAYYFGLVIHGESMEPKMSSGDVVIVRRQEDAETGQTVIATVNGTDATCKVLRKRRDGIELVSTNPSFAPMFYSAKEVEELPVRILGIVKELRAKF